VRDVLQQRLGDGGASVSALAEALGVTRSTVYHWRAGTRGLGADEIMALARELEMTTDQLLGNEPLPPPKLDAKRVAEEIGAVSDALVKTLAALRDVVSVLEDRVDSPVQRARRSRRRST